MWSALGLLLRIPTKNRKERKLYNDEKTHHYLNKSESTTAKWLFWKTRTHPVYISILSFFCFAFARDMVTRIFEHVKHLRNKRRKYRKETNMRKQSGKTQITKKNNGKTHNNHPHRNASAFGFAFLLLLLCLCLYSFVLHPLFFLLYCYDWLCYYFCFLLNQVMIMFCFYLSILFNVYFFNLF